jgi:hypothetical protein
MQPARRCACARTCMRLYVRSCGGAAGADQSWAGASAARACERGSGHAGRSCRVWDCHSLPGCLRPWKARRETAGQLPRRRAPGTAQLRAPTTGAARGPPILCFALRSAVRRITSERYMAVTVAWCNVKGPPKHGAKPVRAPRSARVACPACAALSAMHFAQSQVALHEHYSHVILRFNAISISTRRSRVCTCGCWRLDV